MSQCKGSRAPSLVTFCALAVFLAACTSEQVFHANAPPTIRAERPPAEQRLLDVAIEVFDPGLPKAGESSENSESYREIRRAEARYLPYTLKKTLDHGGHWGTVRLVPESRRSVDVTVTAVIVESNGAELILDVEIRDATGRIWLSRPYSSLASKYVYLDEHFNEDDPFQAVYNAIANDMLTAREKLADEALETTRSVAELRFAADLAPAVFGDYLVEGSSGEYSLNRLPAVDDPMLRRARSIRQRDRMLLDSLDGYYDAFYRNMKPAYREWLTSNYEESLELKKLRRSARNRMGMGAAAVVAGVAGGVKSDSSAGQIVSLATAAGGATVFASGVKKYDQSEIHADALQELNTSFEADLKPKVIEVEGRTVTLTGSAEAQYENWRHLLHQIHIQETGLP
ncbi:MAG: hypothetical protein ACR2O5_01575 [Thiogranum sp.]